MANIKLKEKKEKKPHVLETYHYRVHCRYHYHHKHLHGI